ncbi:hypothetical protein K470DRAFT_286230 [Piedraia hortae CBS 480.64]|uniref:SUN domain-containing protein n=1 Tax=Piedraia hortae CBS 480.64 TaxID=1314780 RepID=A0A6A7C0U1_9PEZI|nr:hypothetical protein K470DRAFT_286230 [Piedraia hortae CBS 480.64]
MLPRYRANTPRRVTMATALTDETYTMESLPYIQPRKSQPAIKEPISSTVAGEAEFNSAAGKASPTRSLTPINVDSEYDTTYHGEIKLPTGRAWRSMRIAWLLFISVVPVLALASLWHALSLGEQSRLTQVFADSNTEQYNNANNEQRLDVTLARKLIDDCISALHADLRTELAQVEMCATEKLSVQAESARTKLAHAEKLTSNPAFQNQQRAISERNFLSPALSARIDLRQTSQSASNHMAPIIALQCWRGEGDCWCTAPSKPGEVKA